MSAVRLGYKAMADLDRRVELPTYDRTQVTVGIVHFGVGGFHRSHQAMYLDRLLNKGHSLDWGICGIGLMPRDKAMSDALSKQDNLYTLLSRGAAGQRDARIIGSIVRYIYAPDDPTEVQEILVNPRTRIVSLTITEGGYNVDATTGRFDPDNAEVRGDLDHASQPQTVFGYVIEALRQRRRLGIEPFTIMSCDNIQSNGEVARTAFAAYAALLDPELGEWVRDDVAFPNSMVDRITPVTTSQDIAELRDHFGVDDAWPVVCEPFAQWVLEDTFPMGRPAWEVSGVQLTKDVEPYELMKLRLLNGGHQAIAYVGHLAGHTYVHEAAGDPVLAEFLHGYMTHEAAPTLMAVPGVDVDSYIRTAIERFGNPAIRDTIARLCAFASDRIPKWLVPVVTDNLAHGRECARSAAVIASWARYAEGVDEKGSPIDVQDTLRDDLMSRARQQRNQNALAFLENEPLFGNLADSPEFVETYRQTLSALHTVGARRTIEELNARLESQRVDAQGA